MDALLSGNTTPTDAKDFMVTTWGWPDNPWPIERKQNIVEDCGWELFSEEKGMLNLAWTELAAESSRDLTRAGQMIPPFSGMSGICPLVGARLSHGRG